VADSPSLEAIFDLGRMPAASPARLRAKKMTETTFTLIRANKNRGGGDDDYDVYDGDKVIGRIVRHPQAPLEAPVLGDHCRRPQPVMVDGSRVCR